MSLTEEIVGRTPLESDGNSGNTIEAVTLREGRHLILKRVSPEWDWMARETNDDGRIASMWETGLLDRVGTVFDHTIVGVERDGGAWSVFMRDASDALFPHHVRLDRGGVRRILEAAAALHLEFWGEPHPELCSLRDRYTLFSPDTGRRELALGSRHGHVFTRGWDVFFERAPRDVSDAIAAILREPDPFVAQLARYGQTLIHGDLRLGNLGERDGRFVLLDWGERVGSAPAAAELGWMIGFDATRWDASKEDVIADFAALYGDRFEPDALALSLLGTVVQMGGLLGFWIDAAPSDARATQESELAWWVDTAARSLETWSPI